METSNMEAFFNFRNCYTVKNYTFGEDDTMKELERVIGQYFTCSLPESVRAVDFFNILMAGDNNELSSYMCVVSDVYGFYEDKSIGHLNCKEALDLLMRTFAKLNNSVRVTHYDENGVGTPII